MVLTAAFGLGLIMYSTMGTKPREYLNGKQPQGEFHGAFSAVRSASASHEFRLENGTSRYAYTITPKRQVARKYGYEDRMVNLISESRWSSAIIHPFRRFSVWLRPLSVLARAINWFTFRLSCVYISFTLSR